VFPVSKHVTSVIGFSLLSFTQNTFNSFFFVTLKDWDHARTLNQQSHQAYSDLPRLWAE